MGASSPRAARALFVIPVLALMAAVCGSPHLREWALGDVSAEAMGRSEGTWEKQQEEEQIALLLTCSRVKPAGAPAPPQDLPNPSEASSG